MNGDLPAAEVTDDEWLVRFILFSKWIRRSDNTVKQEAFIPSPKNLELSVTRRNALSEEALWQVGQEVADTRPSKLYGRADLRAFHARNQSLQVRPDPQPRNQNHAVITGWPQDDKPGQKLIALELAKAAHYLPNPNPTPTLDNMN